MKWQLVRALGVGIGVAGVMPACGSSSGSGPNLDTSPPPTNVVTTEKFGETHTGDGTFYDFADGTGACGFDKTSDVHIAALNKDEWANSAWCGACADVTGPNGNSVRVRIVDECGDCPKGQLDFHPDVFAVLAPKAQGRIAITWSFVACDAVGPVKYKYKQGSNPYWTAVQVRNSRYPIAKFESSKDGVNWKELPRQNFAYFLDDKGFGAGTTQVRITAQDGTTLLDTLPEVQESLEVAGQAQFQ